MELALKSIYISKKDENELNEAIEERKKHRGFLGHKPVRVDKNVNKTQ